MSIVQESYVYELEHPSLPAWISQDDVNGVDVAYKAVLERNRTSYKNLCFPTPTLERIMTEIGVYERGVIIRHAIEECIEALDEIKYSYVKDIVEEELENFIEIQNYNNWLGLEISLEHLNCCWVENEGESNWNGDVVIEVINSPQVNAIEFLKAEGHEDGHFYSSISAFNTSYEFIRMSELESGRRFIPQSSWEDLWDFEDCIYDEIEIYRQRGESLRGE